MNANHVVQRMRIPRAALSTFSSPPPLGYIHSIKLCVCMVAEGGRKREREREKERERERERE